MTGPVGPYIIDKYSNKAHDINKLKSEVQVRTTLNIPDQLMNDLIRETGTTSRTKAVIMAIEQFLRERRLKKLLSLEGRLDLENNWRQMESLELEELKKTWVVTA
jgi:hypothetical protein